MGCPGSDFQMLSFGFSFLARFIRLTLLRLRRTIQSTVWVSWSLREFLQIAGRNITHMASLMRDFLRLASSRDEPFFLYMAPHDPHRYISSTPSYTMGTSSTKVGLRSETNWLLLYGTFHVLRID